MQNYFFVNGSSYQILNTNYGCGNIILMTMNILKENFVIVLSFYAI